MMLYLRRTCLLQRLDRSDAGRYSEGGRTQKSVAVNGIESYYWFSKVSKPAPVLKVTWWEHNYTLREPIGFLVKMNRSSR